MMAATLSGSAQSENKAGKSQDDKTQQQIADALTALAARPLPTHSSTDKDKGCAVSSERRESDLCAQWKAADAAADAAFWAKMGFWMGLITVAALGGTLFQGGRALMRAKEANDTAQDIGKRQVRAYCGVHAVSIKAGEPGVLIAGFRTVHAEITIRNYGQTPAYQGRGWGRCYSHSEVDGLRPMPRDRIEMRLPLGPMADHIIRFPLIVPNEADPATEKIFLSGFWVYLDAFRIRRMVKFRYFLDGDGRMSPAKRGNFSN